MRWLLWSHYKVESLQKVSPNYTLIIISIASPIVLGVYRDGILVEEIESSGKTSDILVDLISDIIDRYPISYMIYARGPGSYMAI